MPELDIGRGVLQHQRPSEIVLDQLHPVDDMIERLMGVGDRQQVVQVLPVNTGPAQVIRNPARLDPLGEILQHLEIVEVGRRGGGDRERHAMHDDGEALPDAVEDTQRLTARDHVVLADDLEPVDRRIAIEDVSVMLGAKAEAEAEKVWLLPMPRSPRIAAQGRINPLR